MARESLKSPVGIARYCNLFTARARKGKDGKPDGDPKFGVLLVFDKKTKLDEMEDEIERVAVEKFGAKARTLLANGRLKTPIRDAAEYVDEEKEDEDNYPFNLPGARMVRFSTVDRPGVVDADAEPIMEKSDVYDGCKLRVSYRVYGYDNNGNKGVTVALINAQKVDDGQRLSGSNPSAEEDFGGKPAKAKPKTGKKSRDAEEDDLL